MNELLNINSEKTFSSRYLVEQINLFRKEEGNSIELLHKSLLTKIESEFDDEIGQQNILPSSYLAGNGKKEKMYELNFEQSLQILMSESKIVRKRCIEVMKAQQKEIEQLKNNQTPKELSRKEILLLALESEERAIIAEQKVLELQPKADFYDTVTDSKDAIDLGATAKVLKLKYGRTTLFKNLRELGVLMKNNQPYQDKIDKEWFIVVESSWSKPNGDSHIYLKTLVLQKGLDGIRKLLKANNLD